LGRKDKLGVAYIFLGIAATIFALKIFPKFINTYYDQRWGYESLGSDPVQILKSITAHPLEYLYKLFNHPYKITTIIRDFAGFNFLSLLSPYFLIAMLPMWAERFWSSALALWYPNDYHYSAVINSILAISAIYGIRFITTLKVGNYLTTFVALNLITNTLLLSWLLQSPLHNMVHKSFYLTQTKSIRKAIKIIPHKASVSAQNPIVSHLSQRDSIFVFPAGLNIARYVIIDTNIDNTWPATQDEYTAGLNKVFDKQEWTVKFNEGSVYVFERKRE